MSSSSDSTRRARRQLAVMTPMRERRVQAGLSQLDLAAKANISPGWLSLIERQPAFMTPLAASKVAKGLGCDAADLLPAGTR